MNDEKADFMARVEEREARLEAIAKKHRMVITLDGRVSEQNAAQLIGFTHSTLTTMRSKFGSGPRSYRIPAEPGHRYSYYLHDLARFIEGKLEGGTEI